ncbi:hypothetical protein AB0469_23375 [Streptomyces sp. NPDC093801]|uniref:hypothetical protein n=1 Tax=Streptomyces sp. NPDC093801 TaxID=3155203 RepID=UPI0034510BC0
MYENAQEGPRPPAPPAAGITDGVVELRKRRPSAPAPASAGRDGRETAADPPGAPDT